MRMGERERERKSVGEPRYVAIYWVLFDDYDAKQNFHIFLLLLLIKLLYIVPQRQL